MKKGNIAVIFGGCSTEHEVSCKSAYNIVNQIDQSLWNIILIGITKSGEWKSVLSFESICDDGWQKSETSIEISPDAGKQYADIKKGNVIIQEVKLDVVWPVLHGKFGEDGTIQGFLELNQIPYVGCGVLASAVSMDKLFTKIIVNHLGINQAKYIEVYHDELSDIQTVVSKIEQSISYPLFVKPANAGSSCGISKVYTSDQLVEALFIADNVDSKMLIEEFIEGREIECAVIKDGKNVFVSGVGEVLSESDFYDYDTKYNIDSKVLINPTISEEIVESIREYATRIFKAVGGYGLSRVDFFLKNNGQIIFNEINTMPGFTSTSMYPLLCEAAGISKRELVEKLIESAFNRC